MVTMGRVLWNVCRAEQRAALGPRAYMVLLPLLFGATSCSGTDRMVVSIVADSIATELLSGPPPVAGLAIAVSKGDELLLDRAYGLSDAEAGEPLDRSRPQRIASLTKQFTAAAVLKLVEEAAIQLDATIQEYLPGFETQDHTVTIRNLLSHTSGLPNYAPLFARTGKAPASRAAVLDTLQRHPFDFPPGESYRYSNSNYYLLGVIIEAVTGDSYANHLEASLFSPLGLNDTGYCRPGGEELLVGYRATAEGLSAVVLQDTTDYLGGSGGLCSTVADLVRWQRALATGRVIAPDTYAMMTTPTVIATGDTVPYGFGVDLETLENHDVVGHSGALAGFNGRIGYYPDADLSVAVLVNTNTPKAAAVRDAVARAVLGMPRIVPTDRSLSAEERMPYVGTYDLGPVQVRVFDAGERLVLQPVGQAPARLLFQGEDAFLADVGDGVRVEFDVEGGQAIELTLFQGSQPMVGARVEG